MWRKVAGYSLLTMVTVAGAGASYLYFRKPASRPAPDLRVEITPARIERGKYIWTVSYCDGCHSQHDPKNFALIESGRGAGQIIPEPELPGRVVAPNITPDHATGLGKWSDGEIMRAVREGVGRDGRALFPMMPYTIYRNMSEEDVKSLIAYMRTLPPRKNSLPRTELNFMATVMIKGYPKPLKKPVAGPDPRNRMQYGEYLVTLSHCDMCHTGDDQAKKFAGGRKWDFAGVELVSANITPDMQTGIGSWTPEYFKERIYRYKDRYPERFTIMPWHNLAQLPEQDLDAIFLYLRQQPAVENRVNPFPQVAQAKTN